MTILEIFSLDLGNKQVKAQSSKETLVLPSHFLNAREMGTTMGVANEQQLLTFKTPADEDQYVWGKDIDNLKHDDDMIDTLMFGNRYANHAFKLLSEFTLGLLAKQFTDAKEGILNVWVVAGLPTSDYSDNAKVESLKDALSGQHQVQINGQTYTLRVRNLLIIPQPVGSLYNQILDKQGFVRNEDYLDAKIGIVDIGGGTILIDTLANFQLDPKNRKQYQNGANDLYESIAAQMNGDVSLFQLADVIRNGHGKYVYHYSRNHVEDITDLINDQLNYFTKRLIANVNSTLKNLDSLDYLLFTGGGANLLNQKQLKDAFPFAEVVDQPELANVHGFYKYGLNTYATENSKSKS